MVQLFKQRYVKETEDCNYRFQKGLDKFEDKKVNSHHSTKALLTISM